MKELILGFLKLIIRIYNPGLMTVQGKTRIAIRRLLVAEIYRNHFKNYIQSLIIKILNCHEFPGEIHV